MPQSTFFDAADKAIPGLIGAACSWRWINGNKSQKLGMIFAGAAFAYIAQEYFAQKFDLPVGLAGWAIGLFGMSIVDSIFKAPWTVIITDIIKSRFGSKE